MPWRRIDDFPEKTGRYIVSHSGRMASDAYFTANEGDTHYPVGWSQMPQFGPTHWLDDEMKMEDDVPDNIRFIHWPDMKEFEWGEGWSFGRNNLRKEIISLISKFRFIKAWKILNMPQKHKDDFFEKKYGPEECGLKPLDKKWK